MIIGEMKIVLKGVSNMELDFFTELEKSEDWTPLRVMFGPKFADALFVPAITFTEQFGPDQNEVHLDILLEGR